MEHLERYYRFQSTIYDATRWMFLFGRSELPKRLAEANPSPAHIVEIGCGTGANLVRFASAFPRARLTGIDLSPDMLALARKKTASLGNRVSLRHKVQIGAFEARHDAVVFSYSLSMMNPGWDQVLATALDALDSGGIVAAVDFHDSPVGIFKAHMRHHHVRMDSHLLPFLAERTEPLSQKIAGAYGGLWRYFVYAGRKAA